MPPFAHAATALALAAAACAAQAAPVTYNFTAVGYAGTGGAGATVNGSFGFDTSAPDNQAWSYIGSYSTGFLKAWVSGGAQDGKSIDLIDMFWSVYDGSPVNTSDTFYNVGLSTFLWLEDSDATAFQNDLLPTALSLADFSGANDVAKIRLTYSVADQQEYRLTSLVRAGDDSNRVPEPATSALVAAAGLGLLWTQRRKPAAAPR